MSEQQLVTPPTRNPPIWLIILRVILLLLALFTWSVLDSNISYYHEYAKTHSENMGDESSWGLWTGILIAKFVANTLYFPFVVIVSIPAAYNLLKYRYKDKLAAIFDHALSLILVIVFFIIWHDLGIINSF